MTEPDSYIGPFQIGKGSVYLLIDQTMCLEEKNAVRESYEMFIHGFKIARHDDENTVAFDGKECTSAATRLTYALMRFFRGDRRTVNLTDQKVLLEPTDEGVRIVHGVNSITIPNDEIPYLARMLGVISGIPYSPRGECP